ncbi:hypothetical protein [Vibrio sp. HN007]|uniref:hypothetical protein n=1 Tax=Vibrio iocasae TaxID=3098914 RepID=UPI0035D4C0BD
MNKSPWPFMLLIGVLVLSPIVVTQILTSFTYFYSSLFIPDASSTSNVSDSLLSLG